MKLSVNITAYLKSLFNDDYNQEIVHNIFGPVEEIPLYKIDECFVAEKMDSVLCESEAGCHNTDDGFQCICHDDLKPVDPTTKSCENRNETRSETQETLNSESTLATFGGNQLLKIFSNGNGTNTNLISFGNQSNSLNKNPQQIPPNILFLTFNPFLILILVLFLVLILISFGIYCHKKLKTKKKRDLNQIQMTGTLSKCMQQYVTNPNYYCSSPDGPMFKLIQDLELLEEDITFDEEIGEGCFGTVFKGVYKQSDTTLIQVAIKVLKDKNESKEDFEREIEIISSFDHKNIIKLIGVVVRDSDSMPYMVFEYMVCGDLAQLLRNKKMIQKSHQQINQQIDSITEMTDESQTLFITHDQLIWISAQIASGCKYLANNHFVHRDLATRNCLVGHNLTVKISDFGMSRDIYTCDYYKVGGSKLLPVRWMSPESILYGKFTLESDVWAFGVVLWEIFTLAKQPYFGHNNEEGILLIAPEDCPKIIYELMAGCWKTEPINRLNFTTILNKLIKKCTKDKQYLLISENKSKDEERVDFDNYLRSDQSSSRLMSSDISIV